ncbi:tripartite tricarboxylate transporter TctB family protein [Dehalobacterium formicoaceticum]|uniref:Tripartite tricarboxylate transporter TctB family protein n=1 Tax=Dehalobacterium formicoaceticum TaxID=51515 RepID=A0ABT1Y5D9_9FIRM|nr:tripartite tricarboxylate transporter TctB family protein [Dehalobacterium formicoaceticum]MCR6546097.1 tripartite tricarboxylate transporter TctB family protein [Dehalobacterium formicoaceticum]
MSENSAAELKNNMLTSKIPITKKTDFRTGICLLILSIFVIVMATKMPKSMPGVDFGPGILPMGLGVTLAVLSILLIIQSFNIRNITHSVIRLSDAMPVAGMFLILLLYLGLMEIIGYGLDTFLLVTYLTRKLGKYALWKCALLGVLTGGLIVYFFRILLGLPLPIGIFGF